MSGIRACSFEHDISVGSGHGYLLKTYVTLFLLALRRTRATRKDLFSLLFMLSAQLLYLLGFKGELRTPVGRLLVTNRGILRSFVYEFFKTHFAYLHQLRTLLPRNLFFPVIIDVGANIGDFTLAMINLAEKIVAVEPAEENFLALRLGQNARELIVKKYSWDKIITKLEKIYDEATEETD